MFSRSGGVGECCQHLQSEQFDGPANQFDGSSTVRCQFDGIPVELFSVTLTPSDYGKSGRPPRWFFSQRWIHVKCLFSRNGGVGECCQHLQPEQFDGPANQFDVAARRTDFCLKYYKKRDIQKMEPSRTVDFFYIFKHIEGELPCDF